jgi:hypothetical protein
VSVACAYVVTPGRDYPADDPNHPEQWGFSKFFSADPSRSVALMPRYNAHFVPVKYCGLDTDYQAAVEGVDASELRFERDDVGGRGVGVGWNYCEALFY